MASEQDELVASYPADLNTAGEMAEFRTTWLVSSHDTLKSAGLFDRYLGALRDIDRERCPGAEAALTSLVANNWLPVAFARAHYEACDALGISETKLLASMKSAGGGQVRRAWHAQIIAAAQKSDVSPWTLLSSVPRWWPRTAIGGGMALYRQAPNQARFEYRGVSLFDSPYYATSSRLVMQLFASHFCKDLTTTFVAREKPGSAAIVLRWR